MRLLSHLPNPQPLHFKPFSTSTNRNPNPNTKWLLTLSRQISTPFHLSQLISLVIISGLFRTSHLPFLNSLLRSFSQSPSPNLSLSFLSSILKQNLLPDTYTFTSTLKAVSTLSLLNPGQQLHSLTLKLGLGSDTFVLNALIHMYSACGSVASSRKVFDSACGSVLDVVSWNSLMSGYLRSNLCGDVLRVFGKMVERSIRMDAMTPVSALIACARTGSLDLGRKIHSLVVVCGFDVDFYLGSSLVSMYARCGDLEVARKVFDGITEKNAVCWNAMISGYAHSNMFRESFELFRAMQILGVKPDSATVGCVISCCGQLGAVDQGRYLHAYCDSNGTGTVLMVSNALIDMYSKCGDIERALQIFGGLTRPDVFSWSAMISGLALNGHSEKALEMFSRMEESGQVVPNEITFLGVLSACSHGGLVERGLYYFERMSKVYNILPKIEHHGCIVDLLGRAKLLREAERFIINMSIEPDMIIWRSLLFACRTHEEVELAEFAAEKIIELEPSESVSNVLLSNVYAVASKWTDVNQIRKGIQKQPGCSFIEVDGTVHEFSAADISHHETEVIRQALWGISRSILSATFTACTSGYST